MQTLVANPKSDMRQIAGLIAKDQAMTSTVIRLANSALYGLRERVGSIHQAIVVLGLNIARNLVIGTAVVKTFGGLCTKSFDHQKFWLSTFARALGAKILAQFLRRSEPEDRFMAGLGHDIRILAENQFLNSEFQRIPAGVAGGGDLADCKRKVPGLTHGEIGAHIAESWKAPEWLLETIRHRHNPGSTAKGAQLRKDKIETVHLADCRARANRDTQFLENCGPRQHPSVLECLRIDEKQVKAVFEEVGKGVTILVKDGEISLA